MRFEIGTIWRTKRDEKVKITRYAKGELYPVRGRFVSNSKTAEHGWTDEGGWILNGEYPHDLSAPEVKES